MHTWAPRGGRLGAESPVMLSLGTAESWPSESEQPLSKAGSLSVVTGSGSVPFGAETVSKSRTKEK